MKLRILAVVFTVIVLVTLSTTVVLAADMFSGTWKLNLEKSTYSPGPPPKEPTVSTYIAVKNGYRLMSDGVTAGGKKAHSEYTFAFDGKDYAGTQTMDGQPNGNSSDQTISAKKVDEYTIEFTFKVRDTVTGHAKAVISKNGKTETYTFTSSGVNGQTVNNTTIWNKQ